jgi:hypothetical protein
MARPTLTPSSNTSKVILTSTGSIATAETATNYAFGIYADTSSDLYDVNFVSGAVDQVAYTYKKLGGDVLDIELTVGNVYAAYEEAVLEYSYLINVHQSKNILANVLGNTTGTFDHDGQIKSGDSLSGSNVSLKYPKFDFAYARRVADGISKEANIGGYDTVYSASFTRVTGQSDYDLQQIVSSSATSSVSSFYNLVGNTRILVRKVYYKTPHAMWRFYGYYGGLNAVGNLHNYGQWADDSQWEIIPVWQNKAQAMAFEDAIYTRNSHYSYEIKNNKLRLFPSPVEVSPSKFWIEFSIPGDAWDYDTNKDIGIEGINNMNTLPFENLPYQNINSIGKQWIRRFAIALAKEILGYIRSKFGSIPIPGSEVTLNGADLVSQGKEEQTALRDELKEILENIRYSELIEDDAKLMEGADRTLSKMPMGIYVG